MKQATITRITTNVQAENKLKNLINIKFQNNTTAKYLTKNTNTNAEVKNEKKENILFNIFFENILNFLFNNLFYKSSYKFSNKITYKVSEMIAKINRISLRKLSWFFRFSLNGLIDYAFLNVPLYARLYKEIKMKYRGHKIPWQCVPLISKHDIQASRVTDIISLSQYNHINRYAETTGSSSNPAASVYSHWEYNRIPLLFRLIPEWHLVCFSSKNNKRKQFAINGMTHGYTIAGHVFGQALENAGFITAHIGSRSTIAKPERVAQTLINLKPALIAATPTDFLCWMRIIRDKSEIDYQSVKSNLKFLLSSAELCSPNRSKKIEEEFEIRHLNIYGSVEGFFTIPCTCGHLHIPEIFKCEIMLPGSNQIEDSGRGRMIFSNLAKKSSPLIRYLLDDDVLLIDHSKQKKEHCSENYRYSIRPFGRREQGVLTPKGLKGVGHFEQSLFNSALFLDYMVIIKDKNLNAGFMHEHLMIIAEAFHYQQLCQKEKTRQLQDKIISDFSAEYDMECQVMIVAPGKIRNYRKVRNQKPLWRLQDKRLCNQQRQILVG